MVAPANLVFRTRSRGVAGPPEYLKVVEVEVRYPYHFEKGDVVLEVAWLAAEQPTDDDAGVVYTDVAPGSYTVPEHVTVRREVPLSDEEAALVQAGVNYGYGSKAISGASVSYGNGVGA